MIGAGCLRGRARALSSVRARAQGPGPARDRDFVSRGASAGLGCSELGIFAFRLKVSPVSQFVSIIIRQAKSDPVHAGERLCSVPDKFLMRFNRTDKVKPPCPFGGNCLPRACGHRATTRHGSPALQAPVATVMASVAAKAVSSPDFRIVDWLELGMFPVRCPVLCLAPHRRFMPRLFNLMAVSSIAISLQDDNPVCGATARHCRKSWHDGCRSARRRRQRDRTGRRRVAGVWWLSLRIALPVMGNTVRAVCVNIMLSSRDKNVVPFPFFTFQFLLVCKSFSPSSLIRIACSDTLNFPAISATLLHLLWQILTECLGIRMSAAS